VIAFNVKLDAAAARALGERFVEAVIAPGIEAEALKALAKKTNLRVMSMDTTGLHKLSGFDLRRVVGGMLAQQWDQHRLERERCEAVTKRKPTDAEWKALLLAWTVAKHVKSNAIVFANEHQTVGVGAGQMSRVDSTRIAAQKAVLPIKGTVVGSDAFFPLPRRDRRDREGRRRRDHPARRVRPRRRDDRGRRRARARHGLHGRAPFQALTHGGARGARSPPKSSVPKVRWLFVRLPPLPRTPPPARPLRVRQLS
jgi:hypothetical protein